MENYGSIVIAEARFGPVGISAFSVAGSNRGSQSNLIYLVSDEVVADERRTRIVASDGERIPRTVAAVVCSYAPVGISAFSVDGSNCGSQTKPIYIVSDEVDADARIRASSDGEHIPRTMMV